jgi:hypothetical protein
MMCRFQDLDGRCNNDRARSAQTDEFKAFDGQCFAFFRYLESWLEQVAKLCVVKDQMSKFSPDEILAQANRGLTFDDTGYAADQMAQLDAYYEQKAAARRAKKVAEKKGAAA